MSLIPPPNSWTWLPRGFATTRWSLLGRIGRSVEDRQEVEAKVVELYWHPLYAFLRKRGYGQMEAQDLVQSFFVRVLEKRWLDKADESRGQFRSFMLTLLVRHVSAEAVRTGAKKRGGGATILSIDSGAAEEFMAGLGPLEVLRPEDVFRRALAIRLFEDALAALRARYAEKNQSELLEVLLPALEDPLASETYKDLGDRLGMTVGAVKVAIFRMRARFRDCLRHAAAVALRRDQGPGLDEELRDLFG